MELNPGFCRCGAYSCDALFNSFDLHNCRICPPEQTPDSPHILIQVVSAALTQFVYMCLQNGLGWGNQQGGGDPDMFGMWMDDLGEEQNSDMDDVSIARMKP